MKIKDIIIPIVFLLLMAVLVYINLFKEDTPVAETVALAPQVTQRPIVGTTSSQVTEEEKIEYEDPILRNINIVRHEHGLSPLRTNTLLTNSAIAKACDLKRGYWAHTTPEGKHFAEWIDEAGYKYAQAGENLAQNYNASEAFTAWMNSPGHRDNILNPLWKEIGIGYCDVYIVTHFGYR